MPRIKALGGTRGLNAPGLRASLLADEREACERDDPRWRLTAAANRGEEPPEKWRRSRRFREALEGGKTVVVPPPAAKWGLPWHRPNVTAVVVTADDLVRPSTAPFVYPGEAVDELSNDPRMVLDD